MDNFALPGRDFELALVLNEAYMQTASHCVDVFVVTCIFKLTSCSSLSWEDLFRVCGNSPIYNDLQ